MAKGQALPFVLPTPRVAVSAPVLQASGPALRCRSADGGSMVTGAQIRKAREQLGWSVDRLSYRVRIDPSTLRKIESGASRSTPDTLDRLAQAVREAGVNLDSNGAEEAEAVLARAPAAREQAILAPYLERAVQRLLRTRQTGPITLAKAKLALSKELAEDGLQSTRATKDAASRLAEHMDANSAFERVSEEPSWIHRVKPSR